MGDVSYSKLNFFFNDIVIERTSTEKSLYYLTLNANVNLTNHTVRNNTGQVIFIHPKDSKNEDRRLIFEIKDSKFLGNYSPENGIIKAETNTFILIKNTSFEENFSLGLGGCIFAEYEFM